MGACMRPKGSLTGDSSGPLRIIGVHVWTIGAPMWVWKDLNREDLHWGLLYDSGSSSDKLSISGS